jgi:signal transduction histidine kinase
MVKIGAVQATSILAITSDHTGQLWLGTQGDGLFQYDQRSGKIIRQYLHSPGKTGISSNIVSSLFVDRSGLLWIGTDAGGLSMFSTKPPQFRTYNNKQMGLDSLPGNFIRAVYSPDRERVFLGILDIGLIEKNLLTGKVRHLMRFIDQSGKSYNNIVSLTPLSERYLLVGTEKKLYLYDTQLNKERELAELMASLVYVESPASILVAALNGTFQFQIEPSLAVVKIDTISMLATTSILIDGRSVIWYGTKGLGLFSYDRQTGHSEKFCFDPTESASLSNDYITTLFLQNTASGQILWVGTRNGLNQMLPTRDGFRRIGTSDGLPNAYIYAIEEDLQHRLWISTNLGLSRFNPAAGIFRNFTTRDGLQSNEFNGRCSFCREDQAFFFGGVNGLNMFYPDSIIDHPETQDIVLTGFNVFDRPYKLSGDPAFLNRLRLDYRQNTVSFQFTALEYVNTGAVQFVYQLQGVDSGWVQAGGKREARYTNLNPGEYIFLVRHANQNNSPGLTIHLELIPPFWATTWFRITSILTLPFLVFGIIRYIEIQKLQKQIQRLKQEKIIEKERSRISRDMHDDIGASLSRIALLSQIIETGQMEAEKVMGKIHDISEMSRNLIDNISEIIWAINPDHDQASSLLGFVRNYIAKSLESADLNYHISFPGYIPELPLSSEFRRNVFLIIKESLANVLKHAQAGEVKVDVQFSEKLFTVTISDNGRGFSPGEARSSGNGLRNIKKRIAELDGQWQVDSAPGHGTTIHFSVPLRTQDS